VQWCETQRDTDPLPVLTDSLGFETLDSFARPEPGHQGFPRFAALSGNDLLERSTNDFGGWISIDPLGGRVPIGDDSIGCGPDDAVDRRFYDRFQSRQADGSRVSIG
jgi:hypothetical protein